MNDGDQSTSGVDAATRGPLRGQVVIVTGASSGIGAATARELARQGATVVLAARREDELAEQARAITEAGGKALAIPTDVSNEPQITSLVERTLAAYGRIDALVNNAGVGSPGWYARNTSEGIRQIVDVNLLAAMLLSRAVLPGMLEHKRGAIISVSSVAGHIALDPLYSGTKYGLRGFSLALRRQLQGSGVGVSLVSPGFIRTSFNRRNARLMPGPEIVAKSIARLILHPRREVVAPWYYRVAIWAERLLPGVADRALRPRRRPRQTAES